MFFILNRHNHTRCFVCGIISVCHKKTIETDTFKYHNSVLKQITVCGFGRFLDKLQNAGRIKWQRAGLT